MASIGISKAKAKEMGNSLARNFTIELDVNGILRSAYGVYLWRLKLGRFLICCAARVMRCGIEIHGQDEADGICDTDI